MFVACSKCQEALQWCMCQVQKGCGILPKGKIREILNYPWRAYGSHLICRLRWTKTLAEQWNIYLLTFGAKWTPWKFERITLVMVQENQIWDLFFHVNLSESYPTCMTKSPNKSGRRKTHISAVIRSVWQSPHSSCSCVGSRDVVFREIQNHPWFTPYLQVANMFFHSRRLSAQALGTSGFCAFAEAAELTRRLPVLKWGEELTSGPHRASPVVSWHSSFIWSHRLEGWTPHCTVR
jgi:hypothetical protein